MVNALQFRVRGMDCAEEIAALKRVLLPLVTDESALEFDLLKGRLTVRGLASAEASEAICRAVAQAGLHAAPWEEGAPAPVGASFWQRRGRALLCGLSGSALAAAWIVHLAFGGGVASWLAGEGPGRPGMLAIAFCIVSIVAGGRYVAPKAILAARALRPDMNLLMGVAVLGAVALGDLFEAASVTFLFAVALLLESWSVERARHAIGALMEIAPRLARFRCACAGGCHGEASIEERSIEDVPVGAVVLVRPGERIPLDGVIVKGLTSVNQAPITGESSPIEKGEGDEVFAGTVNNEGAIEFRATKPACETTLARIIRMVEDAQSRRAPSERWVERFARYYTPAMMALALAVAFLPPLYTGGWLAWIYQGLVVLVIACPCALVISTPVSIVAGLATAARHGVLIKGGLFLEAPARLRAVALDKTGTLTSGRPQVQRVVPLNGHTEEDLIARAAALEAQGTHPISRAILRHAEATGVRFAPATSHSIIRGKGAEGHIEGRLFWVGSHRYVHDRNADHGEFHDVAMALEDAGHAVVAVGNEEHVCGFIALAEAVRPEAAAVVAELKRAGVERVVMLTGDNEGTARAAAQATGVDEYFAELLPEDKVAAVERLVRTHGHVAMVGDGVNDAPALAAATLGIAMGAAGTDVAIETADIALMADDLTRLPWLIRHARRTLAVIRQNVVFALGVKAVFLALAFLGVASLWMAIAADMGASLLVVFNGLRLLRAR